MHCTKEDVNKNMPMLDKQWEGIKGIPGTKSLHHIRVLRENAVEVRKLTHSDESCVCHMLRTDEPDDEHNDDDDMPAVNSDASLSEAVRVGVWVLVKYCGMQAHCQTLHWPGPQQDCGWYTSQVSEEEARQPSAHVARQRRHRLRG